MRVSNFLGLGATAIALVMGGAVQTAYAQTNEDAGEDSERETDIVVSAVQHDELPAVAGQEVHGLQIFINLSADAKNTPPQVLYLDGDAVPVHTTSGGSMINVAVGNYGGTASPLQSTEPVNLLDIGIAPGDRFDVPLSAGWNLLAYCESGEARVATQSGVSALRAGDALAAGAQDGTGSVQFGSKAGARIVLLAGQALNEPVVQYGPFIMNNEEQIRAAAKRFQSGAMGSLPALR